MISLIPAFSIMVRAESGMASSVISVETRSERAKDEARAALELAGIDHQHQLVSLIDQLLLGLDDQGILLHDAERADTLRAHEHAAGIEVARHVVLERRENDALVAVDRAARQHHLVLRMLDEMLGDREGIREHLQPAGRQVMHHLKGRCAAVDDDRIALGAQGDGLPGDGAFLGDVLTLRHAKRLGGEAPDLRRMKRFRPAAHAAQATLDVKRGDVATDRGLGGRGQLDEILNRRDRLLLHGAQNDPVPLTFVHASSANDIRATAGPTAFSIDHDPAQTGRNNKQRQSIKAYNLRIMIVIDRL